MTALEKMKKQAELARVKSAKLDLEVKIAERQEEIERLKAHIEIQTTKENELEQELK